MALIEMDFANGGGVNLSDIIGNTYAIWTYNNSTCDQMTFVTGISTIEMWAYNNSTNIGIYADFNKTQLIDTITTTHKTVDVSNYSYIYIAPSSGSNQLNLKVIN